MMTDDIAGMTDLDIHDELAAFLGTLTFEQEVDRMMRFHPEVYSSRLNCERAYKQRLAKHRAKQEEALRVLRTDGVAPAREIMSQGIKWLRLIYCAAVTALTTFLVISGASLWLTIPLGVFAGWWTVLCTRALWVLVSFQVAVWRLHQAPSLSIDDEPREVKRWECLSNPSLDGWINAATIAGVLVFPAVLWLPLLFWLLGSHRFQ